VPTTVSETMLWCMDVQSCKLSAIVFRQCIFIVHEWNSI
jgi:hypothetical protein